MEYQIKHCRIIGVRHPEILIDGWVDAHVKRLALKRNDTVFYEQNVINGNNISYFSIRTPLPDAISDYEVLVYTDHYMPFLRIPRNPVRRMIQTIQTHSASDSKKAAPAAGFDITDKEMYQKWIQLHDSASPVGEYTFRPLISLIIPVYNVDPEYLTACIDSILKQTYQNFEICIADDHSSKPETIAALKKYESLDSRIHVAYRSENGHISNCSNTALELASGEFAGLVDDDDTLAPNALNEVVRVLNTDPGLDFIYSDEDKIGLDGRREYPNFKPDFAPESFTSCNYLCHFSVLRRSILEKIGGFRAGFEGAQDYDLFLRVSSETDNIAHIPRLLYHWRMLPTSTALKADSKNYAGEAGKKSLEEFLLASGKEADVAIRLNTAYYVSYTPPSCRLEIVIRYNGVPEELFSCITHLFRHTIGGFSAITVIGDSIPKDILTSRYASRTVLTMLDAVSEKDATAALAGHIRQDTNDYVAFIDDRTRIHTDGWAKTLVGYASQDSAGLCAARIHDLDGTLCESGILLTPTGFMMPASLRYPYDKINLNMRILVTWNYSAVNNKCCVAALDKLQNAGGPDEQLDYRSLIYGLSLQLMDCGYRNVHVPEIECTFPESDDPAVDISTVDRRYLYSRWNRYFLHDKYYNRNFFQKEPFLLQL